MATFIVCVTGSALLLAFSLTACSDPGIVYRPAVRIPSPAGNSPGAGACGAAVSDAALDPSTMEGGGVLCGKVPRLDLLELKLNPLFYFILKMGI